MDPQYDFIEACSPGPHLEMFACYPRPDWHVWGNESDHEETALRVNRGDTGGAIERQSDG